MSNFYFQERNDGCENWNLINYSTGPVDIGLFDETNNIKVVVRNKWSFLLDEIKSVCKEAWEFEEEDIINQTESSFTIKINFKILKNYLDKTIIFG
jgi:hypothetical protein